MKSNFNILLYEKDKMLNSILTNELSYIEEYQLCLIETGKSVTAKKFWSEQNK